MTPPARPPLDAAAAAGLLHAGGLVAYPTEAVWGLGCDPGNAEAVRRLLALKQRPPEKGLILVAATPAQLDAYAQLNALPAARRAAVLQSWPGPFTWLVPVREDTPAWLRGQHHSLAVRVSAHPGVIALCQAFGGALVSTSANFSGAAAPRTRQALDPALCAQLDGIMQGETAGLAAPSQIRDAASGAVIRA